jgi:hypothetical protein
MSLEKELSKDYPKCGHLEIIGDNLKLNVILKATPLKALKDRKKAMNVRKEDNLAELKVFLTSSKDELKKAIEAVSLDDKLPKEEHTDDVPITEKQSDDKKTISRDYKGSLPLPIDDYSRHTSIYKQFFAGHISHDTSSVNYAEVMDDLPKMSVVGDIDAISYKERKDYVRTIQMNALMGAMHNAVDPKMKDAYEMWKYASKFNQLMSFMMYETVLSPN